MGLIPILFLFLCLYIYVCFSLFMFENWEQLSLFSANLFDFVGFWAPLILFSLSLIHLWDTSFYLYLYILLFFTNTLFNRILKLIFRQKRPENGKSFVGEDYQGAEMYGMPSGHAQSVFYSTTFLFLVKQSVWWLILELGISATSLVQRWKYNRHTVAQLVVGSIVGTIFASIGYVFARYWVYDDYSWRSPITNYLET